jgi:hypothetical protein
MDSILGLVLTFIYIVFMPFVFLLTVLNISLPQRGKSLVETLTAIEIGLPQRGNRMRVLSCPAGASITTWIFAFVLYSPAGASITNNHMDVLLLQGFYPSGI